MPQIAFASPLLPGMTAADRQAMSSFQSGERKAAFEDSRRRARITREAAWVQTTPNGDFAVVYMEADDQTTLSINGSVTTCAKSTGFRLRTGSMPRS
jgi:hypothetical protein